MDGPKVCIVEDKFPSVTHVPMFAHHGNHVEDDEGHDDDVELLVGHNAKDNCLRPPVWSGQRFGRFLLASLLHGKHVLLLVLRHEGVQRGAALVLLLVELVNDDANKKVEGEERPKHNEGNKVYVLVQVVLVAGLLIELGKDLVKEDNKALTPTLFGESTASSMISPQPLNVAIWNRQR